MILWSGPLTRALANIWSWSSGAICCSLLMLMSRDGPAKGSGVQFPAWGHSVLSGLDLGSLGDGGVKTEIPFHCSWDAVSDRSLLQSTKKKTSVFYVNFSTFSRICWVLRVVGGVPGSTWWPDTDTHISISFGHQANASQ